MASVAVFVVGATIGRRGALLAVLPIAMLALAPPVHAAWNQPVGGASPINQASNRDAFETSLASIGGVPYVAWDEADGTNSELRVARLNAAGTAWEQVVGGASPINQANNQDALEPSLAEIGGVPYVAWDEYDGTNAEIRVARLNAAGTAWEQVVGGASPINQVNNRNAFEPSLTEIGGVPYVAWREFDGTNYEVRVARLNAAGTAWEKVGQTAFPTSPINRSGNMDGRNPSLAAFGGVPYVAWHEPDGTNSEIRVARLNAAGTGWEWVGQPDGPGGGITSGGINQSTTRNAFDASLASIAGVPYVAWDESDGTNIEVRVTRLNAAGTAWEQPVGGPSPINQAPDQNANNPSVASIGGVPYVAWQEADGTSFEVRVARLNAAGTAWEQPVGGPRPINQAPGQTGSAASLTAVGGIPYVAWRETDGTNLELRVSRLEPEFLGPASASATDTSANLSVAVRAFSLPYQVGFDYGPELGSQTATTQTSGETETVTQSVGGLTPSTDYSFRPFASAGVPAPRVLGGLGTFSTAPDTIAPELKLAGKMKQHLGAFVTVTASCPAEACDLDATGTLIAAAGKAKRSALKRQRFKLKEAKGQIGAGATQTLKLRVRHKARKAAAKALDDGAKARAKITVIATDTAGNSATGRRTVRLVP
jgi:hypothetical protein